MRTMLVSLCAAAVALLNNGTARANEAQAAFEKLQTLIGEWEAPLPKNEIMKDIFRPIAFGTALLHEEWKNGEQLTATVFYVVGSELHADHFCDMGNQLRYVADVSKDTQVLHFALREATNLDTHPHYFRSTTWRFVDATHHVQDWEAVTPGKEPKTVRMEFRRTATGKVTDAKNAESLSSR